MASLSFKTLSFELKSNFVLVRLLNLFATKIPLEELEKIAKFKLNDKHTIEFLGISQEKAESKFNFLLAKHIDELTNTLNGNKAVYVHRNSGIPLLGSVEFGIVYRNTSLIEIKTITSCNLNCIYCSISEGKNSCKVDFVVEKDYLIEELQKLLDFVAEPVEVHIGVQGEPFLYADLLLLIEELQNNKQIITISMDTNMTLCTESVINELAKFSKLRLNVSLDTMDPDLANKMAGGGYKLENVLEAIKYAAKKKVKMLFAPVYVPGYNAQELEKVVEFVKALKIKGDVPLVGIQNFLNYKTGRNPVKAKSWEEFYQYIEDLEKKTGMKLRLKAEEFGIRKTKELPKPFVADDVVNAVLKCPDRFPNTCIAAAKERSISVANCGFVKNKKVKVKIARDKHNIFNGKIMKYR